MRHCTDWPVSSIHMCTELLIEHAWILLRYSLSLAAVCWTGSSMPPWCSPQANSFAARRTLPWLTRRRAHRRLRLVRAQGIFQNCFHIPLIARRCMLTKGSKQIYIPRNIPESQNQIDPLYSKRISRITDEGQARSRVELTNERTASKITPPLC